MKAAKIGLEILIGMGVLVAIAMKMFHVFYVDGSLMRQIGPYEFKGIILFENGRLFGPGWIVI